MLKETIIPIPIYYGEIVLVQADNLSKISNKYKLPSLKQYGAACFRKVDKEGYVKYYMAVDMDVTHGLISHEATHIVNMVFKDKHIKIDIHNDEPQAYFMGWVVEECYKHLIIND